MIIDLLSLDVQTLIASLFWANLISVLLYTIYRVTSKIDYDNQLITFLILAKASQMAGYFLMYFRGQLADLLSVNLCNTLEFFGYYVEALTILHIVGSRVKMIRVTLSIACIVSVIGFNVIDLTLGEAYLRVPMASICLILILWQPAVVLLFGRGNSAFKRILGVIYILLTLLLIPRTYISLTQQTILISTNHLVQSLTFLALLLLTVMSLSVFLLVFKENADRAVEILATTDFLTGLSNRYSFLQTAEKVFQKNIALKRQMAVVFLDIDFFKNINDRHGHQFGDDVLVYFAGLIREGAGEGSFVCRYGGEEFIVLLPETDLGEAEEVSARILDKTRALRIGSKPGFSFTASAGVAVGVPTEERSLYAYVEAADGALYEAKNSGRDRYCISVMG